VYETESGRQEERLRAWGAGRVELVTADRESPSRRLNCVPDEHVGSCSLSREDALSSLTASPCHRACGARKKSVVVAAKAISDIQSE